MAGLEGVWPILLPMLIYMLGHGIHQPCGQAGAVGPFPKAAGAASAMSGFVMMVVAFAMGQWLGASMDGTSLPMIHGVWLPWKGLPGCLPGLSVLPAATV